MISSWHRGDYTAVRREFEQLMNHQANAALSKVHLDVLAASLHRQRLSIWAARVFGMAEKAFRAGPRKRLVEPIRESLEAVKLEVRVKLGEQTFDSAFSEGFSMTRHDLLVIPNSSPNDPVSGSPSTTLIEPLTNRELDVLRELAQDLNNPQIAERLVISRRTVDAHLRAIYAKLGVRSRDAAVRVAREQGLFKP
jgi:DNA-binding NarL/FixJ family response regulator